MQTTGYLTEIFTSIQGEGPLAGCPFVFIRLHGCSLGCEYCDTLYSRTPSPPPAMKVFDAIMPSTDKPLPFRSVRNPVSVKTVASITSKLCKKYGIAIASLTGGEPLEQPEFCIDVAKTLKKLNIAVLLETNGQHPDVMKRVAKYAKWLSLDIKLTPVTGRVVNPSVIKNSLLAASAFQRQIIKIPVDTKLSFSIIAPYIKIIARCLSSAEVIFQPIRKKTDALPPKKNIQNALSIMAKALKLYPNCRLLPQIHPVLNIR